ncbi:hypothetical protein HanIR_Chr07g0328911 [Helianthus annuus]|nr:hypothetical protein HanIR_Chr07g0328911 [Helianthus annuus]
MDVVRLNLLVVVSHRTLRRCYILRRLNYLRLQIGEQGHLWWYRFGQRMGTGVDIGGSSRQLQRL